MNSTLRLAVAQPNSTLGDVAFNVDGHVRAVRGVDAQVVVFPELSLTGYAMDVSPVSPRDPLIEPLVDACAERGSVALVGAPTLRGGDHRRYISTLRIDATGVSVVYDKMQLGAGEDIHFRPGESPAVTEVAGWRLGLAICKDTGHSEHAAATVAMGIDAYVAGVCETEHDRNVQPERASRVVREHRVWIAYASFAGSTGGGFDEAAGRSAVRDPNGVVRLELGKGAGMCGWTTLDRRKPTRCLGDRGLPAGVRSSTAEQRRARVMIDGDSIVVEIGECGSQIDQHRRSDVLVERADR